MTQLAMEKRKLVLPSAGLIALLVGLGIYWFNLRTAPEVIARTDAPSLALTTIDGAPLNLAALRGKVVLVDFWATWCGPCRDEVGQLVALQKNYGPRGLQLVGISMDDEAGPVRSFYRKHGMNYPVAIGDAATAERFGGVLGMPAKFLIDRSGKVTRKHSGAVDFGQLKQELQALLDEPAR